MYLGLVPILLVAVQLQQFLCDGKSRPVRDIIKMNLDCDIDYEDEHPEESRNNEVTVDGSHPLGSIYRSEQLEDVEDKCNLCVCLDRSFPMGIRNRHLMMPNREESGDLGPSMSSAADSPLPAFALPPNGFQLQRKPPMTDDAAIHGNIKRNLKKVIMLTNLVERLDEYLVDRTKRFLTRLAFLAKDDFE